MTMLQSENDESMREGNGNDKEKSVSSVQDVREASPAFGARTLVNTDDVFNHNAWDNVEWDEEQEMYARKQIEKQENSRVPAEEQEKYLAEPASFWDAFYEKNENKFFKDRHWLKVEFPELHQITLKDAGPKRVVEVGCGAGNTLFPLLAVNQNPDLFIYAYDFSSTAVEVVKSHSEYDTQKSKAFVWDLTSDNIPDCVNAGSIDIVVLIFVFSALQPQQWAKAVENVYKMLKPGGLVLFRDYGRYDMVQLRFKEGRMLSDNFYIRGDGTRVYFFTTDELDTIWSSKFLIEQNAIDKRLIVNRHRRLKMYRVWLQGKFRKS